MSGIDILAVIDRAAGGLFAAQGVMPGDLMQARAAVEKLIADRAELLEALQWYVEHDDTREGDTPMPEHCGLTWNEINAEFIDGLNKALAAIARATGEGNEPTL